MTKNETTKDPECSINTEGRCKGTRKEAKKDASPLPCRKRRVCDRNGALSPLNAVIISG